MPEQKIKEIRLGIDESVEVRFPGLGTAGYRWRARDGGGIVDVKHNLVPEEEAAASPAGRARTAGRSRDEQFRITGLAPGTAVLVFEQSRPWESRPVRTERVRIVVDGAGQSRDFERV